MRHHCLISRCRRALACAVILLAGACAGAPAANESAALPQSAAPSADARVLGTADAPVKVIEFTDLQCPYCARFARETWPRLRKEYVDTGKVQFATRDLPLRFHAYAVPAAVAARCAGAQGKYWEYREAVFAAQSRLGSEPYAELAAGLHLDAAQFAACRSDPATLQSVQDDAALAAAQGISGTPSFVIGRIVDDQFTGEVFSGAASFDQFAARIDALLKVAQQ